MNDESEDGDGDLVFPENERLYHYHLFSVFILSYYNLTSSSSSSSF